MESGVSHLYYHGIIALRLANVRKNDTEETTIVTVTPLKSGPQIVLRIMQAKGSPSNEFIMNLSHVW